MNFVSDVLNECRSNVASGGGEDSRFGFVFAQAPPPPPLCFAAAAFDVSSINKFLFEYEALLMDLVTENKLSRFLTSNRVRKKLEILNSNLHTDVSKIFLRLRTDRRPSVSGRATPAAAAAAAAAARAMVSMPAQTDDTMVRRLLCLRVC